MVQATGGRYGCATATCARVALEALREANAKLVPPGTNVTAGGEEVPCEFQRVSREELLAMTREERTHFLTRLPTVISGATDDWPAHETWTDPQRFSATFGHHQLRAVRAGHGFGQMAEHGGSACLDFDSKACPGQDVATISLAELVPWSDKEQAGAR